MTRNLTLLLVALLFACTPSSKPAEPEKARAVSPVADSTAQVDTITAAPTPVQPSNAELSEADKSTPKPVEAVDAGGRWTVTSYHIADGIGAWSTADADTFVGKRVVFSPSTLFVGLSPATLGASPNSELPITACGAASSTAQPVELVGENPFPIPPWFARVAEGAVLFGDGVSFCLKPLEDGNPVIEGKGTLLGKLEQRTFQGPPGYGETPELDLDETVWVVVLSKPMLLPEAPEGLDVVMVMPATNELQATFREMAGKEVQLQGSVEVAQTGHHYTAVIMFDATLATPPQ